MSRDITEPTPDEYGADTHPAFGMIGASRVSTSSPGSVLFDSEIRHQHSVIVRIHRATRRRDLQHDWLHPTNELIEIEMSEAQWASFVSSMNVGSGVPCTLRRTENSADIPDLEYSPRLKLSMQETRDAAHEAFGDIREAFGKYKANKSAANLRDLEITLQNAVPNVDFAGKSLARHVENTVLKARADIEAIITSKAQQLGVEATSYAAPLEIETQLPVDCPWCDGSGYRSDLGIKCAHKVHNRGDDTSEA